YDSGHIDWREPPGAQPSLTLHASQDTTATLHNTATTLGAEGGTSTDQTIALTVTPIQENPVFTGSTATSASEEGGLVTLGASVAPHDGDDGAVSVTISGLAHDLTSFSGGSYAAVTGSWSGTAAEFNALSFHAGEDGTQNLTITAATTGAEAGSTQESYTLTVTPDNNATIVLTGLNADH